MTGFVLPGGQRLSERRDAASGAPVAGVPVISVPTAVLERIERGDAPDEAQALANLQDAFPGAVVIDPTTEQPIDASQTFRDADGLIAVVESDGNIADAPDAVQDASPDPSVCDVCSAAKLAESGVMPSRVPPEELHAKCREPGNCSCGCAFSGGGRCSNCGRTQPHELLQSADGDRVECLDRAECAKAMLDRPAAASTAKSSTKPASTRSRSPRPASVRPKETRDCGCGCGETTGGGMYRPGHDSKHVKRLVAAVRARGITQEAAVLELPTDALKAKLTKQLGG